jgi:hypothetical protein
MKNSILFHDSTRSGGGRLRPGTAARTRVDSRTPAGDLAPDDIYQFKNFDAAGVRLLLNLDPTSLDRTDPRMSKDDRHLPVSWANNYGERRVFYTALGDWEPTWHHPGYRTHFIPGNLWAMKRTEWQTTRLRNAVVCCSLRHPPEESPRLRTRTGCRIVGKCDPRACRHFLLPITYREVSALVLR